MDESAVDRAKERLEQRADAAAIDALLVRAREQVETLSSAVEDAVRGQAEPVARNLAEVRGLMNQVLRRLEHLEADAGADRHARVDDLALLVELITSGWKGVDARLGRIEAVLQRLEQASQQQSGAVVYRMEDRR